MLPILTLTCSLGIPLKTFYLNLKCIYFWKGAVTVSIVKKGLNSWNWLLFDKLCIVNQTRATIMSVVYVCVLAASPRPYRIPNYSTCCNFGSNLPHSRAKFVVFFLNSHPCVSCSRPLWLFFVGQTKLSFACGFIEARPSCKWQLHFTR